MAISLTFVLRVQKRKKIKRLTRFGARDVFAKVVENQWQRAEVCFCFFFLKEASLSWVCQFINIVILSTGSTLNAIHVDQSMEKSCIEGRVLYPPLLLVDIDRPNLCQDSFVAHETTTKELEILGATPYETNRIINYQLTPLLSGVLLCSLSCVFPSSHLMPAICYPITPSFSTVFRGLS